MSPTLLYIVGGLLTVVACRWYPSILAGHECLTDGPLILFVFWPLFGPIIVAALLLGRPDGGEETE